MNFLKMCAGTGSQALGLLRSGFEHGALVKLDSEASSTWLPNTALQNGFVTVANYA